MSATSEILPSPAIPGDLRQLAGDLVAKALRAGARDAEVVIREGDEFSALVRLEQVEKLKESGSRGIGIRVFTGSERSLHSASASTSDFSAEGLRRLVCGALDLARVTSEDSFAGLPEPGEFGALPGELDLYHQDVYSLPVATRIEYARRAEAAAMAADPRIQNSAGGGFDAATGRTVLANSRGFLGEYRRSYCSLASMPIASAPDGKMQRDFWYSSARKVSALDTPEAVGAEAARRTIRRLNARRVATQRVPVVFATEAARSLVGHVFEAASGDSIYRGASFLAGQLEKVVAAPQISIVDDGTLPGLFGTTPFDGEGLPTRRTPVIEDGVLKSYLLNTYSARKLGLRSTGNASRPMAGNPGIGTGNLYLQAGSISPQELIGQIQAGFYVTELMGFGVNAVTGDYSRGAAGLWIENGELTYAVEEVTIAGNLKEMLRNIAAVANDLEFRGPVASPTLCVDGMTVAGE